MFFETNTNYNKMKIKRFRPSSLLNNIFELTLFIFCSTGLIYQTYILLDEYISGKTVVSLIVGRIQSTTPPALTICQELFSLETISKIYPGQASQFGKFIYLQLKLMKDENAQANFTLLKEVEDIAMFMRR